MTMLLQPIPIPIPISPEHMDPNHLMIIMALYMIIIALYMVAVGVGAVAVAEINLDSDKWPCKLIIAIIIIATALGMIYILKVAGFAVLKRIIYGGAVGVIVLIIDIIVRWMDSRI